VEFYTKRAHFYKASNHSLTRVSKAPAAIKHQAVKMPGDVEVNP